EPGAARGEAAAGDLGVAAFPGALLEDRDGEVGCGGRAERGHQSAGAASDDRDVDPDLVHGSVAPQRAGDAVPAAHGVDDLAWRCGVVVTGPGRPQPGSAVLFGAQLGRLQTGAE